MYEFDSFFALTPWERVGLGGVSGVFAAGCLGVVWVLGQRLAPAPGLVLALAVFFGFVWFSPQGYYAYYRVIFEDLPPRWVIPDVPGVGALWEHLTFSGRATLSSHGKGVLGWVLIGTVALAQRKKCRDAAN